MASGWSGYINQGISPSGVQSAGSSDYSGGGVGGGGFLGLLGKLSPGGSQMLGGLNDYLNAPTNAAKIQADAQLKAEQMQKQMFEQIVKQEQPFLQGGYSSENSLRDLLGLNGKGGDAEAMKTLQNLPGYQFQKQQGDMAVQNSASATTGALSGASLKSLSNYNQGLASTYYNNYVNNLMGNTNIGLNAASNAGQAGTTLGTGAAQAAAGAGASIAGGVMGQANNEGNAASSIASLIASISDRRLKRDIKHIGKTEGGIPLYAYRYLEDEKFYIGPMADEVRKIQPEAVFRHEDGYDRVFYGMLR